MLTPTLKRLEAVSLIAFSVGVVLLLCGGAQALDGSGYQSLTPLLSFFGILLVVISLIFYVIFLVFTFMRDHELWKRSLDDE